MTIIFGVDPGSRVTGFGVIRAHGQSCEYMGSGCIRTRGSEFADRLHQIFLGLDSLMQRYKPQIMSIEQVFIAQNAATALKLGHARGVAMATAMQHSLQVCQYSARQIKLAVVGYGAADKRQVQEMVCRLLKVRQKPSEDAADGLAAALCHLHSCGYAEKVRQKLSS